MRQDADQAQHSGKQSLVGQLTGTDNICLHPGDRRASHEANAHEQCYLDARDDRAQPIDRQPHARL